MEGIKEAIWLKCLLGEISIYGGPTVIYFDNQSAIHLVKEQMYHEKSKHNDAKFPFVRQVISNGIVEIKKIAIAYTHVDMLNKPLPIMKFSYFIELILVCY